MYSARPEIMLALSLANGDGFEFAVDTAAHQKLTASYNWRWAKADLLGAGVARQYTGQGDRSITLEGVIYPHVDYGQAEAIDELRDLADRGEPMALADGAGNIFGLWVIEKIDPVYSAFIDVGLARRIDFKITLAYFGEEQQP